MAFVGPLLARPSVVVVVVAVVRVAYIIVISIILILIINIPSSPFYFVDFSRSVGIGGGKRGDGGHSSSPLLSLRLSVVIGG